MIQNRVTFIVTEYKSGLEGQEFIVSAEAEGQKALVLVFPTKLAADTFAAAMNNAMDLADGHPRQSAA